jgi:arginine decarboxylase
MKVLMVDDELSARTASGRASRALAEELRGHGVKVVEATSVRDGESLVLSDPSFHCILLDWTFDGDDEAHTKARGLLALIRSRNGTVPIFLMAERGEMPTISVEVMRHADELVWMLEDTTDFVAGRVVAAMRRYRERLLPPFTSALMSFAETHEYSWHTPGHTGGTAFLKSPVGRVFFEHFGERLLRSDLSVSVGGLGSLLDHSGPIGESERYAARVFGAHRSYTVTNGTSSANRIVLLASATSGDVVLCDRNCHKSIEQSLALTGAVPAWLVPTRNHLGLIGPIPAARLAAEQVAAGLASHPLLDGARGQPVHAVLTNSTYDGLCYQAARAVELLGRSVDRVHFDEAWFGHARFHPLYAGRCAMGGDPAAHPLDAPTVLSTTSTHKLLAALSQASFIHVRQGRRPIEHTRFNEAFMMQSSTSPLYAIIASNEISAAMMDGPQGPALLGEAISEAVAFRKALGRLRRELAARRDWFFSTWGPDVVSSAPHGGAVAFEDAPDDLLHEPQSWVLRPGAAWHGFSGLDEDWCLLDPIKVSVVTPGLAQDGSFEPRAIPARLVSAWLEGRGIVAEKTTDFTILLLFSIGITKGKWGTLVNALLDFKDAYDRNALLAEALPSLVTEHPGRYDGLGLRDLADEMLAQMKSSGQLALQARAYSVLPRPAVTPQHAWSRFVRGEAEAVPVSELADRIVATGIVPYPPGIPLLVPGEVVGPADGAHLGYLRAIGEWDRRFPGFGLEVHGVFLAARGPTVYCLAG